MVFPGRHPVQGNKRVIAGDSGGVSAGSNRYAHFQHPPERRRTLGRFRYHS